MNVQVPTRQELWRHYEVHIELYKHYLKLTLEFNAFFYAITGAIVSYYFAHQDQQAMRYSLLLPVVMSGLFVIIFVLGGFANLRSRAEVSSICRALGLQIWPEFIFLSILLWMFAALMLLIAIGLILLMFAYH